MISGEVFSPPDGSANKYCWRRVVLDGQYGIQPFNKQFPHSQAGFLGRAANMGQDEGVWERAVARVQRRLAIEDIQASRAQPARGERRDHILIIHQIAAPCIDENGTRREFLDQGTVCSYTAVSA